jgi:LysR family transcriptional activator of glutamate synthase operon
LSSAIHNLETELGNVRLFEKVGRNIRLTEEGRYYQEKVDAALRELNTASMTLRESKVSAPVLIRLGVVSGTVSGTVAEEIASYLKQNDRIRFRVVESASEELMDMIRQEKLDMAIVDVTDRDRTLHFRRLCRRSFYAALPVGHPLSKNEVLTPQELSREPQIVFNYDFENSFGQWASGIASDEHIVCAVNTAQAALDLVRAGVGICVVSDDCVQNRDDIQFLPIENWHQALYMCILYDKWLEPPVWSFVEQLVRMIRKNNPDA